MDENASGVTSGFDLFVEPWIACVSKTGDTRDYGIEGLLRAAHELGEIVDPSPLVTVSVLRLLEAVLIWSLKIDDEDRWYELWVKGRFGEEEMARVAECCSGHMDLLHPSRPFYQSSDVDSTGAGERVKSVGSLLPDAATGTAVVHYVHAGEDDHAFCPACCAKALVQLPAFATSGGQGIKPSINGVPPTYVLPLGETVFRTLLLNWPLAQARPQVADSSDSGPAWLGDGVVAHKEERAEVGFVESLTWQPRRIRLLEPRGVGVCTRCGAEGQRLTSRVVLDQGLSRPRDAAPWLDPWTAYVWLKDKLGVETVRPIRPREERQTWRDIGALFLADVPEADSRGRLSRPALVEQLARLAHELEGMDTAGLRRNRFITVGIRTDMKAKVFEWRFDRFELPHVVLGSGAAAPATRALLLAEGAGNALGNALLRLHPGTDRDNPSWGDIRQAMADTVMRASREFWTALEIAFREALFDSRLPGDPLDQSDWLRDWIQVVRRTAVDVLEQTLDSGDDTASGLRRQESARRGLYSLLKKGGVE